MSNRSETDDTTKLAIRLAIAVSRLRREGKWEKEPSTAIALSVPQLAVLREVLDEGPTTAAV